MTIASVKNVVLKVVLVLGALLGGLAVYGIVLLLLTGGTGVVLEFANTIPGVGYVVMALIGIVIGYYVGRTHGTQ
jgi:hypothetical protein